MANGTNESLPDPQAPAERSIWRAFIFSTDHKVIGIQYGLSGLAFMLFGFGLMILMRWQMAHPGQAIPIIGGWLGHILQPEMIQQRAMTPQLFNSFGAMHGTIMVFLGVVPVLFGGFGNFLLPLQLGAVDMAFPRLNMASFQLYFLGGVVMLTSFFIPGGAAQAGWTSYPPLATLADPKHLFDGQVFWLIGMALIINSSLLGAINFIATITQLRARGLHWMRLPFFVWAELVTAFLLLLAFPPLESAAVLQLMDKLAATSFFLPTGMVVSGAHPAFSGGGSPLLWQHLFWFLAHPEVYVLILPAMGIVCEILANNTRRPIHGYEALVYSALAVGFLSFIVWGHHMFLTGMGVKVSAIFQTTTMAVSIPSVVILTCFLLSLWGGSIRFNTPMLFALAFLPMFGIGGLSGLPLGLAPSDRHLHDTFYVIGHFHYVVAPGTIFALFAGIYYWFPKITGRTMGERLGRVHFWLSLIFMNLIFLPMFAQGMAGMNRRLADGGAAYSSSDNAGLPGWTVALHPAILHATWMLAVAQVPFVINLFKSLRHGVKAPENPWQATTLEWQTGSPPVAGNFPTAIEVHRGPYEYSPPGVVQDYLPQNAPEGNMR